MIPLESRGIAFWVRDWARRRPEKDALVFGSQRWTWRELDEHVDAIATGLRDLGVGRGDRVACLMRNRPEYLELFWAVARLGAVFVPLNTRLARPELAHTIADAEPRVVVTESGFDDMVAALRTGSAVEHWVTADEATDGVRPLAELRLRRVAPVAVDLLPSEPVAILFTSGTTGPPKGAVLSHDNIATQAVMWVRSFSLTGEDRHMVVSPLCFAGGLIAGSMNPVLSGATMVLEPEFDVVRNIETIERERITWFNGVPLMVERILRHPRATGQALASLRRIQSGGSPVPAELVLEARERGIDVMQGYGLSECTAGPSLFLDSEDAVEKAGSVGRASLSTDVRVVDEHGREVEPETVGELLIRGPMVMSGYWRNPAATASTIRDGWLHTGDLARVDRDGFHYVVGRSKDMVLTGGLNVYPMEVERVLNVLPGVRESAVVGLPDPTWGEAVVAVIVRDGSSEVDADRIIAQCREHLAGYKCPKQVHFVDELPRTASQKVRKDVVRERLLEQINEPPRVT